MSESGDNVEIQARALGWLPQEEFKGNPANWVDAQEFLDRGEKTLPAIQSDRRRLLGEVTSLQQRDAAREQELRELRDSLEALKETTSAEARAKADAEIKELRRQLAEARRSGDVDAEIQAEEQLEAAKEKRSALPSKEAAETPKTPPAPVQLRVDPAVAEAMNEFKQRNPWYETDMTLQAAANGMTYELMKEPDFLSLSPREKFARLESAMRRRFNLGGEQEQYIPRVEGSGPTVTRVGPKAKTYENLPPEAKATVERQAARLVGPNRAFKTMAEWKKHFVDNYDWSDEK